MEETKVLARNKSIGFEISYYLRIPKKDEKFMVRVNAFFS